MDNSKIMTSAGRFLARASVLCAAMAAANPALAQQWRIEPIVRVGGEYDDNAALHVRTDEEIELTGLLAELRAIVRYSSETTNFDFEPRVVLRDYGEDDPQIEDYNTEDIFLRSTLRYEGQSSTLGFRVFYDQQQVRTAERAVSDPDIENPDDLTEDDSGRVVFGGTRDKIRVTPFWSWKVSERSTFGADVNYTDVGYEDVIVGILDPYSDIRLNLRYSNQMSNRTSALLTLTGRQFSPDDPTGTDIDGYGLMGGFERRLSEKTRVTALVGLEAADGTGDDDSPEFVSSVTLRQNLETINLFARYKRSVNASGAGSLTVRDSLDFNFQRRLTEKITAGLGVRAYAQRGKGSATDERNYIQLQSNMQWYMSRSFLMEVAYRYTVLDRSALFGERSNSNQVNLWLVYQPRTAPRL